MISFVAGNGMFPGLASTVDVTGAGFAPGRPLVDIFLFHVSRLSGAHVRNNSVMTDVTEHYKRGNIFGCPGAQFIDTPMRIDPFSGCCRCFSW